MSNPYDQRQRWDDPEEASRSAMEAGQANIWTSMPVIFKKHDTDKNTVHAQIAVKLKHIKADGSEEWKEFPLLKDVPVHYPGGGGASWTFPIKDGDEGLIMFASRSIDKWWAQGGTQEQLHARMHDISDGFAIPGFRSQANKLTNVHATKAQLRTDDGTTTIEFDPAGHVTITSNNPIVIAGDLHVSGAIIAGFGTGDQVALQTHTHAQLPDSHGDIEVETIKPTAGT